MVYDFNSPSKQTSDAKIHILTFDPRFLYGAFMNYWISIILSLILITLSGAYDAYYQAGLVFFLFLILSLLFPISYFIHKVRIHPYLKTVFFLRTIYLYILSIISSSIVFYATAEFYNYYWDALIPVLLFSLVVFLIAFGIGKIFIKNIPNSYIEYKTPSQAFDNINRNDSRIQNNEKKYSQEDFRKKLMNTADLRNLFLFYYIFFAGIIIYLFASNYSSIDITAYSTVRAVLFSSAIIFFLIGIAVAYLKYLLEKQENKFLSKDLFTARSFLFSLIAFIFVFFNILIFLFFENRLAVWSYYVSWKDYFFQLMLIVLIPLIFIIIFFYNKWEKRRELDTYEYLLHSPLALNLTKYYLLTRLSEIKNVMDTTDPLDFDLKFKRTIIRNIKRLKTSYSANQIDVKSETGLKKYVLHAASPLRESLREAIGKNYTELYLSDTIPSEERVINYDEIWRKINKAFLQWESEGSEE